MVYGQLILENAELYGVDDDWWTRSSTSWCATSRSSRCSCTASEQHAAPDGAVPEDDPQAGRDAARFSRAWQDAAYGLRDCTNEPVGAVGRDRECAGNTCEVSEDLEGPFR